MTTKRLVETFINLVGIDSVSKHEDAFHKYLYQLLEEEGMSVIEDQTKETTGLGGNNIIARFSGKLDKEPLFFSCHTDTVTPGENIRVVEKDGVLYSEGQTILGADNKAGIAILTV